ncbi:Cytochrome P450 2J6 [Halotydeus destructor]|nr:Cytochrome P450 2J6 [Halotydeus destructor]
MDFSLSSLELYVPLFIATVFLVLRNWLHRDPKWPKGPRGWPLVGYQPYLGPFSFQTFQNLQAQYGPIFTIPLFTKKLIVVNGLQAVKEIFSRDELLGRPEPAFLWPLGKPASLVDGSGDTWKEQRRFAVHHLRDHGFGKPRMEELIREEIDYLTQEIAKQSADHIDILEVLTPSIMNNIFIFLFGRRFDYDDPRRTAMADAVSVFPAYMKSTGLTLNFPTIARYVYKYKLFGYGEFPESFDKLGQLIQVEIDGHRSTLDKNCPRDYIDSFLIEQLQRQQDGQAIGDFNDEVLIANAIAFCTAGSETVRSTVTWAFMLMVKHPDVQDRIQLELDTVIGHDRAPTWADRIRLPYTSAVLMEAQRWASAVPMSLPRRVLSTVVVNGVTLPEGATVIPNLWSAHHDSKVWNKPDEFNPLNFYDESSRTVINKDMLVPFSYGRRNCVGQVLGQVELFLYFSTILQKFHLGESKMAPLSLRKTLNLTLEPEAPPMLRFRLRHGSK